MENINRTINMLEKIEKRYENFISEISYDFINAYEDDDMVYLGFDKEYEVNDLFYRYLDEHYNEYNEVDLFQWLKENQKMFNDYLLSERFEEMKNEGKDIVDLIRDCMWYNKVETLLLEETTIIKIFFLKKLIKELKEIRKDDLYIDKDTFEIVRFMDNMTDCREINKTIDIIVKSCK